jgi:hypothetical protein
MSTRFRYLYQVALPRWFWATEAGEKVVYSLGVLLDMWSERLRQGVLARMPTRATETALPYLSRDRKIIRGVNESAATFAARLPAWLDTHRTRGNPFAMLDQVAAFIGPTVGVLRIVDRRGNWFSRAADGTRSYLLNQGNWDWDGAAASPRWARFWLIIEDVWTNTAGTWGDGAVWGDDGDSWGGGVTTAEVQGIRSIVREWKPAGRLCEWIIVASDPADFAPADPAQPAPDPGTWGNWSENSAGTQVETRLGTARFWRGIDGRAVT